MYKKILIPLALDQGHGLRLIELARKLLSEDGKIVVIHIIDQVPGFAKYYMTSENEEEIDLSAKKAIAERIGSQKDADVVVLTGHPGRTVTDYAKKIIADCIIVGSHKPSLKGFFLGSTAARIVRYATCSVHVLRQDSN